MTFGNSSSSSSDGANSSSTRLAASGRTKLLPSHCPKLECLAPSQPEYEAFFSPRTREQRCRPHAFARLLHLHNFLLAAFQTHEPSHATYPLCLDCIRRAIISDSPPPMSCARPACPDEAIVFCPPRNRPPTLLHKAPHSMIAHVPCG